MKKENVASRRSYSPEFKEQAVKLAQEIGVKQASEQLGIPNFRTLGAWVRYHNKMAHNEEFRTIEQLKAEQKELKKEIARNKKVIAILEDVKTFFCQDHLK